MDTKNIGVFLSKLRKENNLTQADIAKLCNVSAQAVSKWERGDSVPDIEILEKLSIMYKLSINELINGEKQEVYINVEKRTNIISLTFSVLIFIAYLFPFMLVRIDLGFGQYMFADAVLKGYEVIFNGISGLPVVVSLFTFLVLLSYVIINIFVLTKIIDLTRTLKKYIFISGIMVLMGSIWSMLLSDFLLFPQLLIMGSIIINMFLRRNDEKLFGEMKNYYQLKRDKLDVSEYTLTDNFKTRIRVIQVIILLTLLLFVSFFITAILNIPDSYQHMNESAKESFIFTMFLVALLIGYEVYILYLSKTVFIRFLLVIQTVIYLLIGVTYSYVAIESGTFVNGGLLENVFFALIGVLFFVLAFIMYQGFQRLKN